MRLSRDGGLGPDDMTSGFNAGYPVGIDRPMKTFRAAHSRGNFTQGSSSSALTTRNRPRQGLGTGNKDACGTFSGETK
jgi:hypothetical protein